jgi:hypothetical protein
MQAMKNLRNILTVTLALAGIGYGVLKLSQTQVVHANSYTCCSSDSDCYGVQKLRCEQSNRCGSIFTFPAGTGKECE